MGSQLFHVNDGGALVLEPHQFQMQSWYSQARLTFLLKGWRAGFSSSAPFWLLNEMTRCGPGNPALRYFCIAPNLSGMRKGLLPEMIRVFCTYYKLGKYNQNNNEILISPEGDRWLWGHEQRERTPITFCYAEEPDSFASMTAIAGVGDEIGQKKFKLESYNTLLARMSTTVGRSAPNNRHPRLQAFDFPRDMKMGRLMAGSTVYQLGWLEDLWDQWRHDVKDKTRASLIERMNCGNRAEREEMKAEFRRRQFLGLIHPNMSFIRFDSTANPSFAPEEFVRARASLPSWFFDMRYRAIFRKPAGTIFDGWDASRHVVAPFKLPSHWPRRVAIDFGKKNFHALFIAHDEERDRHFIYRHYADTTKSNCERAKEIIALEPNIEFCVAGQISEEYDRVGLAEGGLASSPPMYKSLWAGINTMASAIQMNKLFVFRGVAPEFESEVRSYSRPVDENGAVKLDEDPEDKENYHCFIARTEIEVETGKLPVENIKVGDKVLTRDGWKPVTRVGNRYATNLREVTFSDGRTLVGTGEHPIWVEGKGFIPIDSLRYYDIIKLCPIETLVSPEKPSFSTDGSTTAIQMQGKNQTATISRVAVRCCIARFGSLITGRFRQIHTFITLTATRSTTIFPTSLYSNEVRISAIITKAKTRLRNRPISTKSAHWLPLGIRRPKAAHGTPSTLLANAPLKFQVNMNAISAAKDSSLLSLGRCVSARSTAKRLGDETTTARLKIVSGAGKNIWRRATYPANTVQSLAPEARDTIVTERGNQRPKNGFALLARKFFKPDLQPKQKAAPVHVLRVRAVAAQTVYNLSVAELPEYYANGVLVHNCTDPVRYYGTYFWRNAESGQVIASSTTRSRRTEPSIDEVGRQAVVVSPEVYARGGVSRSQFGLYSKYGDRRMLEPHLDITLD